MRECLHRVNQIEHKQSWIIFKSQHAFNQSRPAGAAHEKKTFQGFPSYNYLLLISAPFFAHIKFQRNFISSLLLKWIDTHAFLGLQVKEQCRVNKNWRVLEALFITWAIITDAKATSHRRRTWTWTFKITLTVSAEQGIDLSPKHSQPLTERQHLKLIRLALSLLHLQ